MARRSSLVSGIVLLACACRTQDQPGVVMSENCTIEAKREILRIIDDYPNALERGDPRLWESLFWLDDPDFTVIENDKPHRMGREYIDFITGLIRERGKQPPGPRWYQTEVHFLSPGTAYTTSLRDEVFPDGITRTSRITLVFKKKAGQWRIIHGHFSVVPEQGTSRRRNAGRSCP